MRLRDIEKLVVAAQDKEAENHIWDRWVRLCAYMETGQIKFVAFNDYKNALLKPKAKASEKTSEEIMAELLPIISAHERERENET